MIDFDSILLRIAKGDNVSQYELLPHLCSENKEQRCKINARLASAYSQFQTPEYLQQAKVFIQRAWILSNFSDNLLPLYIKIFTALGDTEGIRDAYKRLGIKMASQRNISEAIRYFNLWQNSYAIFDHVDKFEYDFDIIDCMERLTKPYRFKHKSNNEPLRDRKIRLAYLVKGITDINSVLVKIKMLFAKFHDRSQFEVFFFFPEKKSAVLSSPQGKNIINQIKKYHCKVRLGPDLDTKEQILLAVAKSIYKVKPHFLITSAALAEFDHYFITMLNPSPINIAFVLGPPPQFVAPNFDWSIALTKHPLMDCPVDCSLIDFKDDLPKRENINFYSKRDFNIPEDSLVILSGGRPSKFQDRNFWKAIIDILDAYKNTYYLAVGVQEYQVDFLKELVSDENKNRIRFLGWREDFRQILGMADIVIDTFPSGGGIVLTDAMSFSIPIVSFANNYMRLYDQTDWSPAEEFINVPDIIIPRGDFEQLKVVISKLINDEDYRRHLGDICYEQIHQTRENPEGMVKRCEEIYIKVLEQKINRESYNNRDNLRPRKKNPLLESENQEIEILQLENYSKWQEAYLHGYNADMGDHRKYFYNIYLNKIGYYNEISKAQKIVEFAPGKGDFIEEFIRIHPQKQFYLIDISESNLNYLKSKFVQFKNINYILNNKRDLPLQNVDSVFSFLLCQSMPKSLWIEHLKEVYHILNEGGSYVFQFAYYPERTANDSIGDSIAGSQAYPADNMTSLVKKAGFEKVELSEPISLEYFRTDVLWYFCKAMKLETK
jgi:glycosyltransferase involved in cell wall biosynthesis/phospholipid N-methyltransferase